MKIANTLTSKGYPKPKKINRKGLLIVIDGIDGAGKGTQTELLRTALAKARLKFEIVDFPQYGSKSAGPVEEYLNGKYDSINPFVASVLYGIDRYAASFNMIKALNQGKILIANRYVTANAGHQGGKFKNPKARKEYMEWLLDLEYNFFGIPTPDLNILLHIPTEVGYKLIAKKDKETRGYLGNKKRDIHEKDKNHLKNAENTFLQIAESFPKTTLIRVVKDDVLRTPEDIHAEIWQLVQTMIKKRDLKNK